MSVILIEPQLVLGYSKGGVNRSVTIPTRVLKAIAKGEICPSSLDESRQAALLSSRFVSLREAGWQLEPRLYWQTGVKP